jgi:hypothetical protein
VNIRQQPETVPRSSALVGSAAEARGARPGYLRPKAVQNVLPSVVEVALYDRRQPTSAIGVTAVGNPGGGKRHSGIRPKTIRG